MKEDSFLIHIKRLYIYVKCNYFFFIEFGHNFPLYYKFFSTVY